MKKLSYRQRGDYQLPLILEPENQSPEIGKYGRMRLNYLTANRPVLYTNLLTSGRLSSHLAEVDWTVRQRLEQMVQQTARNMGVTEALKEQNALEWTGLMNNIRISAEEVLLRELVYS